MKPWITKEILTYREKEIIFLMAVAAGVYIFSETRRNMIDPDHEMLVYNGSMIVGYPRRISLVSTREALDFSEVVALLEIEVRESMGCSAAG